MTISPSPRPNAMILVLINNSTTEPFETVLLDLLNNLNVPISNHTTPFISNAPSIAGILNAAIPTRTIEVKRNELQDFLMSFNDFLL